MKRTNRDRSLGKTFNHISRNIHWVVKHQLERYGVGSGQHFFLFLLDQSPGITQNEVSRKTNIDKATAAKGLAKLDLQGYIKRVPDTEDRRLRRLYLTEKGKEIIPKIKESLAQVTEICSADLSEKELEVLFSLLDKVESSLSTYVDSHITSFLSIDKERL
ncbi:MAG: MarR family winged helix-turn-helix transcriptional regulator [Sphaerochaeta sp.]|uniref:MarR family winged helix-turn-helix transcriptional regulator n=1 Tax=Sphaerochaeta sp. TaxID=1972642 RepID=UPI003D10FDB9